MVSTFTTNKAVEKPGSGDYPGTWDVPVNANMNTFDSALGTVQAISLAGGSVVLSTAQARSAFLNFTGALPGNVTVTFPGLSSSPGTIVSGGFYTIQNQCSNSSAFTVTLATTVVGQQSIACPPYEPFDILIEGTNSSQAGSVKFRNLGRVGSYWDYAGSSVPAWVTACTVPPYLNCDASTFSSATYPALATILGGTGLPDSRGRFRAALNQGTGRITAGISGVDGNTWGASGGSESLQAHIHGVTDPQHSHQNFYTGGDFAGPGAPNVVRNPSSFSGGGSWFTANAATGISINSAGSGGSQNVPPAYVGGLTLIRAA